MFLCSQIRCPVSTESCCKIKPKGPQTTSQTYTGSYQSTTGQNIQSASQITTGSGLVHVAGVAGEKAFGQQQNYNQFNQNTGKPANDVKPPFTSPGATIYQDSAISQSQQTQYTRPNFGNAKNPGTPYLPPKDEEYKPYSYPEPENPYNPEPIPTVYQPIPTVYKPIPTLPAPRPTPVAPPKQTPYVPIPTQYKPQPTPYQPQPTQKVTPTPYRPQPQPTQKVTPTPYKPQPTPYKPQITPYKPEPTPPKPTGPAYLPPLVEEDLKSSFGSQQIVPRPGDNEGSIILDETRTLRPKSKNFYIIIS